MYDDAQLSRLLFEARELIDMLGDIVEARSGRPDVWSRLVRDEIDAYRAERGWSPDGYGGEASGIEEAATAETHPLKNRDLFDDKPHRCPDCYSVGHVFHSDSTQLHWCCRCGIAWGGWKAGEQPPCPERVRPFGPGYSREARAHTRSDQPHAYTDPRGQDFQEDQ